MIAQIESHINSFPKRTSHYSRQKNTNKFYLSPELNIKKLYELYLEKYENEMFQFYSVKDKKSFKPKVTYDFFFRFFKANFNLSFGTPRSDTCKVCDIFEKKLTNPELTEEERKQLKLQEKLHKKKLAYFLKNLPKNSRS